DRIVIDLRCRLVSFVVDKSGTSRDKPVVSQIKENSFASALNITFQIPGDHFYLIIAGTQSFFCYIDLQRNVSGLGVNGSAASCIGGYFAAVDAHLDAAYAPAAVSKIDLERRHIRLGLFDLYIREKRY